MKKTVSLFFVLVLVLCCLVGCNSNSNNNNTSSEIRLDEIRPSNQVVMSSLAKFQNPRGYSLLGGIELKRAEYDSATKICVVEVSATFFARGSNDSREYDGTYRITYELAEDGSWEQLDYPTVLTQDYMPALG